jgi:hypothetical protein
MKLPTGAGAVTLRKGKREEMRMTTNLNALITPEAKQMLDLYVDLAQDEVSGLGIVSLTNGQFCIEKIYLLKQECSTSETELDPEAISLLMTEMMKNEEDPGKLKLWWHSHANMGVFWSTTDEATAGKFGNGWMLSVVANKKREYKVRLDIYDPVHVVLDDINLVVSMPVSDELRKLAEEEVKEKITSRSFRGSYWDAKTKTWYGSQKEIGEPDYYSGGYWGRGGFWEEGSDILVDSREAKAPGRWEREELKPAPKKRRKKETWEPEIALMSSVRGGRR